jgi:hypothetical protein
MLDTSKRHNIILHEDANAIVANPNTISGVVSLEFF